MRRRSTRQLKNVAYVAIGARGGAKSGAKRLEALFQQWLAQNEFPLQSMDDSRNKHFGDGGVA